MALTFVKQPNIPLADDSTVADLLADPGFVTRFTDHMVEATWTVNDGWHDGVIDAYGPIDMPLGSAVLHYAQEIFEGVKAYRHADGSIWLFRPEMNAIRFANSAARLDLPQLPVEDFIASLEALVSADARWVPSGEEMSLYVRPFMFAYEEFLGVRSAQQVRYAVVAGAAAPYMSGLTPSDIWITREYSRCGNGGTGSAKCGGNYASSLMVQKVAAKHGCGQVLFTDAADHEWIEELGGMNVFFVTSDDHLVTPNLNGNILPGVTRDSILALADQFGLKPVERPISLTEMAAAIRAEEIVESFACGTAAVIAPIGRFRYELEGEPVEVELSKPVGPKTQALRQQLVDIQWGRTPDTYGWMHKVV
jgi:branched-chain amino acid aminotransferase